MCSFPYLGKPSLEIIVYFSRDYLSSIRNPLRNRQTCSEQKRHWLYVVSCTNNSIEFLYYEFVEYKKTQASTGIITRMAADWKLSDNSKGEELIQRGKG